MKGIFDSFKKDCRPVLSVLLLIFLLFNWVDYQLTTEVSVMGISDSSASTTSYSGFGFIGVTYVSLLLPLIPILLLCVAYVPVLQKYKKALYPIGSLLGIVCTVITMMVVSAVLGSSAGGEGYSVEGKAVWGIGVWLTMVTYLAEFILSLIIDFKINKETLQGQGLKGALTNVVGEVAGSANELANSVKSGELQSGLSAMVQGAECPQCGNMIAPGKKFCTKCGYKVVVPESVVAAPVSAAPATLHNTAATETSVQPEVQPQPVMKFGKPAEKVKMRPAGNYSGVVCDQCFCVSDITRKFCPDCGTKLNPIRKCGACGMELLEGKTFCAECGTPADYRKTCKKCGQEILPGKAFCTECGEAVDYSKNCANCGAPVVEGKKFCPDCGHSYYAMV